MKLKEWNALQVRAFKENALTEIGKIKRIASAIAIFKHMPLSTRLEKEVMALVKRMASI